MFGHAWYNITCVNIKYYLEHYMYATEQQTYEKN
jgi:hypothetical protein